MKGVAFASPALKNSGTVAVSVANAQKTGPVVALPEKGVSRFLLIVGLVLMFILAIFLGGVIAVLTLGKSYNSKTGALNIDTMMKPQTTRMACSLNEKGANPIVTGEFNGLAKS